MVCAPRAHGWNLRGRGGGVVFLLRGRGGAIPAPDVSEPPHKQP